ncbi:MAG: RNA polymerase sigma factor [Candidatus Riflebacteria bacterium]|nr:RNA polymerase sigma factor [Candidatus Riflebacteria bacterium]
MKRYIYDTMKKHSQTSSTDQLLKALAKGDLSALEELYRIHAANLYKYAVRILANPTEAEDMVHEVFLRIWKNKEKCLSVTYFRAWALRICNNICIDRKRKADYRHVKISEAMQIALSEAKGPEKTVIDNEILAKASEAFYTLSFEHQQVLALSFDGDLSVTEIADTIDCSVRTVHYRIAEAIKRLRMASGGNNEDI